MANSALSLLQDLRKATRVAVFPCRKGSTGGFSKVRSGKAKLRAGDTRRYKGLAFLQSCSLSPLWRGTLLLTAHTAFGWHEVLLLQLTVVD